jgi:hypothetical protein
MEHLNPSRSTYTSVAPPPTGILNNLSENGIDPGKPPDEITTLANELGQACVTAAFLTPVGLNLGTTTYSNLRTEKIEGQVAREVRVGNTSAVNAEVNNLAATSLDPAIRDIASEAGKLIPKQPQLTPAVLKLQSEIEAIKASSRAGNAGPAVKQQLREKQKALDRLRREHKRMSFSTRTRAEKTTRRARKSMQEGVNNPTRIAHLTGTDQRSKVRDWQRGQKEANDSANQVSTKGAILIINGRKHVVVDTKPQPVQAFRPDRTDRRSSSLSDPILDRSAVPSPDGGFLHDVYINTAPPGQPLRLISMPRGAIQPGGTAYQSLTGTPSSDGNLYYRDGAQVVPSESVEFDIPYPATGILPLGADQGKEYTNPATGEKRLKYSAPVQSEQSFVKEEDEVVLQPLLSGAEAIQALVGNIAGQPEFDETLLKQVNMRLSELEHDLSAGDIQPIKNRKRKKALKESLIFKPSDTATPPELRPPHDTIKQTGHFSRYTHQGGNPETTRAKRWDEYIKIVTEIRHRTMQQSGADKAKNKVRRTRIT